MVAAAACVLITVLVRHGREETQSTSVAKQADRPPVVMVIESGRPLLVYRWAARESGERVDELPDFAADTMRSAPP